MAGSQDELTDSQRSQLRTNLGEQDASENRVKLQPAQTLPSSYVEAVLLDADGEPTSTKRILFPDTREGRTPPGVTLPGTGRL